MTSGAQGGKRGTTKASVDPVFYDRVKELREQARTNLNAVRGKAQRVWAIPASLQTSILAVDKLHEPAFDRTKLNNQYTEITSSVANAGTVGDVVSVKTQLAYVAAEERAFRARHTSMIRAFCAGHGRKVGQGFGAMWSPSGGVSAQVAAAISAGADQNTTSGVG